MNDDTDVPPRSSRQNPAYRPTSDTPALHSQRIQSDARQIHTRSVAPYCCAIRALCCPIATQYGLRLRLCAHCVARIRLRYRPISRVALNTGSLSSRGCAPLTPGCILAPFQGALFPLAIFVTSAVGRCPFPLVIFVTSAVGRCPFPLAIYGEGGGRQAGGEVRQAGGEVRQAGGMVKTPLMERPPPIFN